MKPERQKLKNSAKLRPQAARQRLRQRFSTGEEFLSWEEFQGKNLCILYFVLYDTRAIF